MSKCGLEDVFRDLAAQLPLIIDGDDSYTFTSQNLPVPPSLMETEKLYIKKSLHIYNDIFQIDKLYFYAKKETHRNLGLLILAAVFHPQPSEVIVKLNHSESDILNLVIEFEHPDLDKLYGQYRSKPFAFQYYPTFSWKHPFEKCPTLEHLPCFGLTHLKEFVYKKDWGSRDTVRIFGTDIGMVKFAQLLLNAALPDNEENEYELEGEGGFRGVGLNSAEIGMFLPGHIFWVDEHWN